MKKLKKFLKNNLKLFIGFVLGSLLSGFTVYASTIYYNGENVGYDNTTSGMTADNVQDALDELYSLRTGTATAGKVLAGYTFSNVNGIGLTGTMTNNGAVSETVGIGDSYTIPKGYHNGNGTVSGPTLSGNAAAGNVLSGKTFYSNSAEQKTGTMANNGSWSKTVSSTTATTGGAGYYSSVSCAKAANTGTFTTSTNGTAVDMGANQNYRYVNTTGVYNAGKSAAAASRVKVWSGSTLGNISVNLSSYTWVYIKVTGGSTLLLQVNGAAGWVANDTTSPDGNWSSWVGARQYKATSSGITALSGTRCGVENHWGNVWLYVTEVWGIKNLS